MVVSFPDGMRRGFTSVCIVPHITCRDPQPFMALVFVIFSCKHHLSMIEQSKKKVYRDIGGVMRQVGLQLAVRKPFIYQLKI